MALGMSQTSIVPRLHLLLALAVMAVWGTNFVVIKLALEHLPPLWLATLRFACAFLPTAFFLKRPAVPVSNLAAYGVLIGAGQFGLLFLAMKNDITPGLASLVVQIQVFFTIALSMRLTGERVRGFQWAALALATSGLAVILTHSNGSATPLGLGLVVTAAFCWSNGNMVSRAAGKVDMLAYVVWASIFAVPPLFLLALLFEGVPALMAGVHAATPTTWAAVVWQAVGNTMFGYGVWGWLLARHPAATVAPMALLVPVFGIGASALFLGEPLQSWKLLAAALVMGGLALSLLWPRYAVKRKATNS
ncbi:EamA family transporter [Sphingorhabdus sp. EL138]|jgi:O-acetylserine/cysteine efflux transporter|uniref:EamA family transporter n=1 Tax=Sphingorhabdus sp. EL138 TaxID=2073156 RepID=UPI0025EFF3ED|nr:EamA family transporter [Sphingorhabdus sp. EL138]